MISQLTWFEDPHINTHTRFVLSLGGSNLILKPSFRDRLVTNSLRKRIKNEPTTAWLYQRWTFFCQRKSRALCSESPSVNFPRSYVWQMVCLRGIRGFFHFLLSSTLTPENTATPDAHLCGKLRWNALHLWEAAARKAAKRSEKSNTTRVQGSAPGFGR